MSSRVPLSIIFIALCSHPTTKPRGVLRFSARPCVSMSTLIIPQHTYQDHCATSCQWTHEHVVLHFSDLNVYDPAELKPISSWKRLSKGLWDQERGKEGVAKRTMGRCAIPENWSLGALLRNLSATNIASTVCRRDPRRKDKCLFRPVMCRNIAGYSNIRKN
jgi:hypothetical protein